MGNVRDDDEASYGETEHGRLKTEMVIAFIEDAMNEAISKAKAEIAEQYKARGGSPDNDTRMQCLNLAVTIASEKALSEPDKLTELADKLAQYVLTGKKPGEA